MTKKQKSWPNWMSNDEPESQESVRYFNGNRIEGWNGIVPLKQIHYWMENERTDVQLLRLQKELKAVPDDDQLFDYFEKDPQLAIESLAKNILQNGLRERIVIASDKTLLDGNRRYLAHRWIAKYGTPQERQKFSGIASWVVKPEFSEEPFISRIVAEYNFVDDFKKKWKDFVKAKFLHEQYNSLKGYTLKDLVTLYGGPGFGYGKIVELIRTYDVIMDFANASPDYDDALEKALENFIWFQQLWRSYRDDIRNDDEFQQAVFDNIRNDYVGTTNDLKNLKELRKYKEAWALFKRGEVKDAHIVYEKIQLDEKNRTEPDDMLLSVNSQLERLLAQKGMIERTSESGRTKFHELAQQVPGHSSNINMRVSYLTEQLGNLSSAELASLPNEILSGLQSALEQVIQQAQATRS
jgi:hypothetical protein